MKLRSILAVRKFHISNAAKLALRSIALCIPVLVIASSMGNSKSKIDSNSGEAIPVPTISPVIPQDVAIPPGGGNPIAFFDDFSWRSFIALGWPAMTDQRGVADTGKTINTPGPRVFETYKDLSEVFHIDGSAPVGWDQFDSANGCLQKRSFGDMVLASFSKFSNLAQAGFGRLVGPLVAQNRTYVRYLTAFNKIEFDQILARKLYLRDSLQNPVKFQNGAIDVKSAWIDMKNVPHPDRYYTRMAIVMDPDSGFNCSLKLVGLVGLHIAQKTPSRPQWIWSTFEQIDNIKQPGANAPFTFHDADTIPMPAVNPFPIDPLIVPTPHPFNVDRKKPIHPSTQLTNAAYQNALKQQNSVWQFYQLVMTQWPLQMNPPNPIPESQSGLPAFTFPGTNPTSAFSNITMETFEQDLIRTGCMSCHNGAKKTDFLWALNDHAFPADVQNFAVPNAALKVLKQNMQAAQKESIRQFNLKNTKQRNQ